MDGLKILKYLLSDDISTLMPDGMILRGGKLDSVRSYPFSNVSALSATEIDFWLEYCENVRIIYSFEHELNINIFNPGAYEDAALAASGISFISFIDKDGKVIYHAPDSSNVFNSPISNKVKRIAIYIDPRKMHIIG